MYKLLIADDEREIRNGLCNFFPWNEIGFEVVATAENGKQALEYLKENTVDVLLCDIKMPQMTGIEVAKEIYTLKARVKVVFLSGYKEFEYAQKALMYNVKNYIIKPTKYSDIAEAFNKIRYELDEEASLNIEYKIANVDKTACLEEKSSSDPCVGTNSNSNYYNKIVANIKSYIRDHYKDATLEEAAAFVHLNSYYLSNLFKQKTGENFSDYVIKVKMEKAAELLNDVNNKINEVSTCVGYSSAKNFARTFKRYFNKSPREYRNSIT